MNLEEKIISAAESKNSLIITFPTSRLARKIYNNLLPSLEHLHFLEEKEEINFKLVAESNDILKNRLSAFFTALHEDYGIYIMSQLAFEQKVPDKSFFQTNTIELNLTEEIDLAATAQELTDLGYSREHLVEGLGQFSIHGGILDISSVNGNFRIELFGDEIDSIRRFDLISQRSIEKLKKASIFPAKEDNRIIKFENLFKSINTLHVQDEIEVSLENIQNTRRIKKAKKDRSLPKNAEVISSFQDLQIGDYIVHRAHGIGKYLGIKEITINDARTDYLQIKYAGTDKLYIPTNQLNLIYKYIGKDAENVRLSKLGGAEWKRAKARVKKSCKDIAKHLMKIYAERQMQQGIAFSEDNEWQREFESTFEWQETDDQLKTIQEVKLDMQNQKPMDRLVCGDVGYGKTEVAMRAAFKAVLNGFQIAYLVPTTILARQHFATFSKRMEKFGVKVALLSRFCTSAEAKEIVKKLAQGEIDIVIGTHRILQKDVSFNKLGLLIIDEEQRFGVTHKEKIKEFRANVDVLTLTATPIPRTLHMSLVGIRDMSLITQPPHDRYPVSTYVLEYDLSTIISAIEKEIHRGGQVYYLHNRVDTIHRTASKIKEALPSLNVAVAHGQMNEQELESIMQKTDDGEIDVLVCTTIIETGLDIPNINTIIIENSDKFGLAQLYQLRGRVGRSSRLAHAYLTYQKDKVLTEVAQKRLEAIERFTALGSGFKLALKDLEIRGAGNIIGGEQHGHMEAVGYELYCKFLDESIKRLKKKKESEAENLSEETDELEETIITASFNAYLPENYIEDEIQRMEFYSKIANVKNEYDKQKVVDELQDRYGKAPKEVITLLDISILKTISTELRISEIRRVDNGFLIKMHPGFGNNFNINLDSHKQDNVTFLLQRIKSLHSFTN